MTQATTYQTEVFNLAKNAVFTNKHFHQILTDARSDIPELNTAFTRLEKELSFWKIPFDLFQVWYNGEIKSYEYTSVLFNDSDIDSMLAVSPSAEKTAILNEYSRVAEKFQNFLKTFNASGSLDFSLSRGKARVQLNSVDFFNSLREANKQNLLFELAGLLATSCGDTFSSETDSAAYDYLIQNGFDQFDFHSVRQSIHNELESAKSEFKKVVNSPELQHKLMLWVFAQQLR